MRMLTDVARDAERSGFDRRNEVKQIVNRNVGCGVPEIIQNLKYVSLWSITVVIQILLSICSGKFLKFFPLQIISREVGQELEEVSSWD